MRKVIFVLVLSSIACGERAAPTPTEVVPEPGASSSREEPEPSEAPEPEPVQAPREGMVEVVDLPDDVSRLASLETAIRRLRADPEGWAEPGRYPVVTIPGEPERSARVNAYIERLVRPTSEFPSTCRAHFVSPQVISLSCDDIEVYERGGSDVFTTVHNLEIDGDEVRHFSLHEVISPTANLEAKLRRACAAALRRAGETGEDFECRDPLGSFMRLRLSPRGVMGKAPMMDEDISFTVPFSELDRGVYADTALGRTLAALPGATVATIELPEGAVRAGTSVSGLAFGEPAPARVVLGRFMLLPPEARRGLVIAGSSLEEQRHRLAVPSGAEANLELIRQALGEPGEEAEWSTAAVPRVVRTRVETNFRNSPGGERALLLPAGTLLAVALGRVDGRESAIGSRGTWALSAVAPGVSGFTAGSLLEEYEGCEPPIAPFLESLPEANREAAERTLIRAFVSLRRGGRERAAIAYGAAGRPNRAARLGVSRVEVHEAEDGCALGRRVAAHDLEGNLFALRLTSTRPHGGATLLLIGSYLNPSRVRWELFELGGAEPVWAESASVQDDVLVGERVEGEYYPVILRRPAAPPIHVAWTDEGVEIR